MTLPSTWRSHALWAFLATFHQEQHAPHASVWACRRVGQACRRAWKRCSSGLRMPASSAHAASRMSTTQASTSSIAVRPARLAGVGHEGARGGDSGYAKT